MIDFGPIRLEPFEGGRFFDVAFKPYGFAVVAWSIRKIVKDTLHVGVVVGTVDCDLIGGIVAAPTAFGQLLQFFGACLLEERQGVKVHFDDTIIRMHFGRNNNTHTVPLVILNETQYGRGLLECRFHFHLLPLAVNRATDLAMMFDVKPASARLVVGFARLVQPHGEKPPAARRV